MTDYYSDNDPSAAEWMRELIREGHLPEGTVDERSIKEITGRDLDSFRRVHLFAGIGGWAYALRLAGWPAIRPVWTGSCPCQPFSAAGKRKGQADERHLWPVFLRLIRECRPATVFGEQVASDDGYRWLARVRDDLEETGYAVGCADLPACSQGAPVMRQRLWWVACANGGESRDGGLQRGGQHGQQPQDSGVADGLERTASNGRVKGRTKSNGRGTAGGRGIGGLGEPACGVEAIGRGQETVKSARDGTACGLECPDNERRQASEGAGAGAGGKKKPGRPGVKERGRCSVVDEVPVLRELLVQAPRDARTLLPVPADRGMGGGPLLNFWSRFHVVPCGDGKIRRFEPESFPLAHGIPGRVGLLRGYGNAINPWVAAHFIKAFLEAESDLRCSPAPNA